MAIGDNFNDVEMLQYAGVGVAMGNAPRKCKRWRTG
ncbi:HAD hydrolase family protein [Synechocystis sp. B12]|nr:HAD hydrolase family protein [Synechocystis sp. B12]